MTHRIVHSLIVWLLLLTTPFQGFAAASMLPCAPMDHAASGASAEHAAHHGHAVQHVDAMSNHAHHTASHDVNTNQHGSHAHQCGFCAACCLGGTMTPLGVLLTLPDTRTAPVALTPAFPPAFFPDLPERPPKRQFA